MGEGMPAKISAPMLDVYVNVKHRMHLSRWERI
jgi:hypothetical protein